jgi:hypothetical protein
MDEMDSLIKYLEHRRHEWTCNPTASNHAAYVDSSVPVDVDDCQSMFDRGYTIPEVTASQPVLSNGRISSYEGEWNDEVAKSAERARYGVSLALNVLKAMAL